MKTSKTGRELIERFEGLILGAYDDANDHIVKSGQSVVGTLTIGYGHTSAAGAPRVRVGDKITREQADQILGNDLAKVEVDVTNLVKVPLNQNQFDALVSFHFNTGALGKSSALKKLNAKDYKGAADALTLYTRGNGQQLQGLVTRRNAERQLFLKLYTPMPYGTGVGGAVIGGTVAVTNTPQHYWPWIIGGLVIAAIVVEALVWLHRKAKNVKLDN